MVINQAILEWQNALPSFGISYSGPKDGQINQAFIDAMMALEGKYKAYGQIFSGSGVNMSVSDAKKKFMMEAPKDIPKDTQQPELPKLDTPTTSDQSLKIWESFLSTNLPVVGKVYDGDLPGAAKKLEAAIGKSINKPMSGIIWSDAKKQFNTTPDDVKKALEMIQAHTEKEVKPAQFTSDQRIVRMSQMLFEKS